MAELAPWSLWVAAAFLIGAIPFGVLLARARGIDIRQHGSKNVGATNVWRVLGWKIGLTCFILDALKGALPVAIAGQWLGVLGAREVSEAHAAGWLGVAAGACLGHMHSPFLGFKGGKGVATGLGALLALYPQTTWAALGALALWLLSARLTRMVGISSCIAAFSLPILVAVVRVVGVVGQAPDPVGRVRDGWVFLLGLSVLAALIVWKHRANLARTLAGTENRIGFTGNRAAPARSRTPGDKPGA